MKIVAFSDTHSRHEEIEIPEADVLIFAGDYTGYAIWYDLIQFNNWLAGLPHKQKIVVAGNHDYAFERDRKRAESLLTAATYLQDNEISIDGVKFYGSPWQPRFYDWAFNMERGEQLAAVWRLIPDDTNVLITHCPARGVLDFSHYGDEHVGCDDLAERLSQLTELRAHIFGHIHASYGIKGESYNVSICNEAYEATRKPITIELEIEDEVD